MKASELFMAHSETQLLRARTDDYVSRAQDYLHDQFPTRLKHVADADLETVIRQALARNTAKGLSRDADHLAALIPVIFWGSAFETDPQFLPYLIDAEWVNGNGTPNQDPLPFLLAEKVDIYRNAVRTDLQTLQPCMRAFEVLFARDNPRDDNETCLKTMRAAFPARVAAMSADQLRAFMGATRTQANQFDISGADLVAHTTLALYFGITFANDPLHKWAHDPYQKGFDTAQDQRLALGAGIQRFLDPFTATAQDDLARKEAL